MKMRAVAKSFELAARLKSQKTEKNQKSCTAKYFGTINPLNSFSHAISIPTFTVGASQQKMKERKM